jgi:hypothetical protein
MAGKALREECSPDSDSDLDLIRVVESATKPRKDNRTPPARGCNVKLSDAELLGDHFILWVTFASPASIRIWSKATFCS